MDDLRAHYEVELRRLGEAAARFAERHPALARRLDLTGEGFSEDPHVQRLMQSAALLGARAGRRIGDGFPGFTGPLLSLLLPMALRPFPACAIARFEPGPDAPPAGAPAALPRGTLLRTPVPQGGGCTFRTAGDVLLLPLRVAGVALRGRDAAPAGTPLPGAATAVLSIRLALDTREAAWPGPAQRPLRLYLAGEPAQAAALREALGSRVLAALVQAGAAGPWRAVPDGLPRAVGFADDEALLDPGASPQPAHRLLAEYFAFRDKFHFIDLPWPPGLENVPAREITLHYALDHPDPGGAAAQRLQALGPADLVPGCTPVVNLFARRAQLVRTGHAPATYAVRPDAGAPGHCLVHAIERVWSTPEQPLPDGPAQAPIRPLFALDHAVADGAQRYWVAHPGDAPADTLLSLVDAAGEPAPLEGATLWAEVTATNGELPRQLDIGRPGGDLVLQGAGVVCRVRLLHRPTPGLRFEHGGAAAWTLLSHLSPNHLGLCGGGIGSLRELLQLFDLPRSPLHRRLVESLRAIEARPAMACLQGPYPVFARGTEVELTVDEQGFAGLGLQLFAQVLERCVALHAPANSFTRLRLVSAHDGRPLFRGAPCPGQRPLL